MKLCRFNENRLGLVEGQKVYDVSQALNSMPPTSWPHPIYDQMIAALAGVLERAEEIKSKAQVHELASLKLNAPVANPSKIIGAPVNYFDHLEEALADKEIHHGNKIHKIDTAGLFLKANSALIGPSGRLQVKHGERRVDHEAEIAVIIGTQAEQIKREDAFGYIAGYCLALDMTVRGPEDRSMRKSCDGFAVLGPYIVTPDEIADPNDIAFGLTVNGEERQNATTAMLIRSIPELIEMASAFYTLLPGDVIMTGTPAGVGPVDPGDEIVLTSPDLGTLTIKTS